MEPQQHFKRNADRNTYRLSYMGNNGGSTDWKVDVDYAKMREDDITLTSDSGYSKYEGKNTLYYIDDIMHKQWNMKASANTQLNDKHLLTYGFGYTKENGEGSRLKNAPHTTTRYIDPWDYDKNLYSEGGVGEPPSYIHDYYMSVNAAGIPYYNQDYEMYGVDTTKGGILPAYTFEDYVNYGSAAVGAPAEVIARRNAFAKKLKEENPEFAPYSDNMAVKFYYDYKKCTYNGKTFQEEYELRKNRQTTGRAEIKKQNVYIQDTWQLNSNTILTPIFRMDHSDLFGSNATFNMGLTHNISGKATRRLKANIGTGYTEPGMGELYYNWEMYAGMPTGAFEGKLGYYFIGNPDLKPEKSVNFDIGIEGENGNTSARLNLFHNRIKDYMTTYFTGYLMDFNPLLDAGYKWLAPPDMIYSFKNIGKAEITGLEAEVQHKFNDHWSSKLGYTYLHAINKSDPGMPRQLLDKPQHKVDIGVTYENKDWRVSLWGDYYIHMLDSNSVANNGNYLTYDSAGNVKYNFAEGGKQSYTKKTFGLWNILVQKSIDKDSMVYVGIDNLFNHRDDDQAFQERVYKFGVNMKFGADGHADELDSKTVKGAKERVRNKLRDPEWFIQAPFDTEKEPGVEFIGDYQARWNSFTGKMKPSEVRVTTVASVGSAYKNYLEKADHGFEQRLRAGIDARIDDNTNVTLLGSASGMSGVDTMHDVSTSKGLSHQRMDTVDVTQHADKWDFSIGRLTESMGVTGYWFGKEYDGGRAVWTSGKNQVRIGYGDFSQSTGISDSAYTHATRQVFWRAPTLKEWRGMDYQSIPWDGVYTDYTLNVDGYKELYQRLAEAANLEEQKKIVEYYLQFIKQIDPDSYERTMSIAENAGQYSIPTFA
jgi:outer membrane receptor protein involved in Fe transport